MALLHGLLTGSIATWYFPVALPLSRRRQVIAYDLRGHGASSMPTSGYDLDRQCDDLDAVLDAYPNNGGAFDLVGHSLGALIALHYAIRRRSRIRRLLLIEPPLPTSEHLRPARLALESNGGSLELPRAERASPADSRSPATGRPTGATQAKGGRATQALLDYLDRDLGAAWRGPDGSGGRRSARFRRHAEQLLLGTTIVADLIASFAPPEAAVAGLDLPVLLISGRRSDCVPAADRLARLLPNATRRYLDCGHQVPEEAPAELLGAIESFLD